MSQDGVAIRDIREKSKDREVKNTFIHSAVTPLVGSRESKTTRAGTGRLAIEHFL